MTGGCPVVSVSQVSTVRQYRNSPTNTFPCPSRGPRMKDGVIMAIILVSCFGPAFLLCCWGCWGRWLTSAKPTPTPIPGPTSAEQTGDASNISREIDTSASIFTQDGNLCLPPPAVTRENGGYGLRQQLSSSTGSTLLPMYMDGSDKWRERMPLPSVRFLWQSWSNALLIQPFAPDICARGTRFPPWFPNERA